MDPVYITYFDAKTRSQFINSAKYFLGSRCRSNVPVRSIIMLSDLETREYFGMARVRNAPDTNTPCVEHSFMDADTYSTEYQKYNRYEIHVDNVCIFGTPITYDQVKTLVGAGDIKGAGNMWKGFHCNFAAPFQAGCDISIIERYRLYVNTLANI